MSEKPCVFGTTLKIKETDISGVIAANPLTSDLSNKNKVNNKAIYHKIAVNITGASKGACAAATGAGFISSNSVKNKGSNKEFVLEDAESLPITCNGMEGQNPCSFTVTAQILSPNQDKVLIV